MKKFFALVLGAAMGMPSWAADVDAFQFFEEESSVLSVPGTITRLDRRYAPVSVTTISARDIRLTPARNVYDLIEVYVPGALVMNHHEGPHPGMRGIISDRNTKFLLLVNGRRMNQSAHSGAQTELQNWDMNDIEKIEIIRGPGSVTYGPGAVEGVISLTTKNARTDPGLNVGMQAVQRYNSLGTHLRYGLNRDHLKLYTYASWTATRGFQPDAYTTDPSGNTGYVGRDFPASSRFSQPPLDYYRDSDDLPQGKAYLEAEFSREWTFWARYTNSGTTANGVSPKAALSSGGPYENVKANRDQQVTLTLENTHVLAESLELESMASFGSQNHQRRDPGTGLSASADKSSVLNDQSRFSEDDFLIRSLVHYAPDDRFKAALGAEFVHQRYGPAWGDGREDFRMGESSVFNGSPTSIISGLDSRAIGSGTNAVNPNSPLTYFVGEGWNTNTYSALGEFNLGFDPRATVLLSGRLDKNSYSQMLVSPRAALVSDFDRAGVTKLIWQKSVRMNTAEQLLVQHLNGDTAGPEQFNGVELNYAPRPLGAWTLQSAAFYNWLEVVGWNGATTADLGQLRLFGLELEGAYKSPFWTLGMNHSFIKQLSWTLAPGVTNSGISYSDYNKPAGAGMLNGTGNDLNNWATNVTKLYANVNLTPAWTLHADTRVFWSFPGAQDGLTMVQRAAAGTSSEGSTNQAVVAARDQNVYGLDWRLNVSVNCDVTHRLSLNVFVLNLLGANGNKRYSYDAGVTTLAPSRVAFVEEPRIIGMKIDYKIF